MVDKPLSYRRAYQRCLELDDWRRDYVVGDTAGMNLFPDMEWHSVSQLWENQKALQASLSQEYRVGPTELERRLESMWLVGWLERSHYDF